MLVFSLRLYYNTAMIEQILQNPMEALPYLKEGHTLRVVEKPILLKMKHGILYSSSHQWNVRLKMNDFLDIFQNNTFLIVKEEEGISEEKDEEYYRWRNQYL